MIGDPFATAGVAAALCAAAFSLAACQNRQETDTGSQGFFTPTSCANDAGQHRLPQVGATFDSRTMSGANEMMKIRSTVTGLEGQAVSYTSRFTMPEGLQFERKRATYDGALYAGDASGLVRTFEYEQPPAEAIRALKPGESLSLAVTERIDDMGKLVSANHTFTVKLEDCGMLRWPGGETFVRVYTSKLANATVTREGAVDGAATDIIKSYVSPEFGWAFRRESSDGTHEEVVAMKRPPVTG